jgi:hypothetical protein
VLKLPRDGETLGEIEAALAFMHPKIATTANATAASALSDCLTHPNPRPTG